VPRSRWGTAPWAKSGFGTRWSPAACNTANTDMSTSQRKVACTALERDLFLVSLGTHGHPSGDARRSAGRGGVVLSIREG